MKGQWIGEYNGSTDGKLMINIDEVGDHYEAVAYIIPSDKRIPNSVAYLTTKNKESNQKTEAFINAVNPRTGLQCKWDEIKDLYDKDVSHSTKADVEIKFYNNTLNINSISDIGNILKSSLTKPAEENNSKIIGTKKTWSEFKKHVSKHPKTNYLFRGQQKPWRLCTSFHRRERYRISEFVQKDVPQLHQRLSAITPHFFDLEKPNENGAFFNLLQHHGYPTPLLDWTRSPYVAAFFAFRDWEINYEGEEVVRVYIFNNQKWQSTFQQIQSIDPPFPHLSVAEFIAINNPRLVPQQSVTTVTNLHDIESYILEKEQEANTKYIEAIDIPANQREEVMADLRFMGITPGSMFPSIDGVCEEYRERNFEK